MAEKNILEQCRHYNRGPELDTMGDGHAIFGSEVWETLLIIGYAAIGVQLMLDAPRALIYQSDDSDSKSLMAKLAVEHLIKVNNASFVSGDKNCNGISYESGKKSKGCNHAQN